MLAGKRIFFDIFPDFLSWIKRCVNEAERKVSKSLYPGIIYMLVPKMIKLVMLLYSVGGF